MKRFRWDKKYLYWGMTAFFVIAACILFYMLVSNLGWLGNVLHQLGSILSPFVWGLVIAYLLYPLMRIYQRSLFRPLCRRLFKKSREPEKTRAKAARGLSVCLSIITLLVVIAGLIWLVVPQIYSSVEAIVANGSAYVTQVEDWLEKTLENYPQVEAALSGLFGDLSQGLFHWLSENFLPEIKNLLAGVTMNLYYVLRGIYNVFVGIIVSVYVLYDREGFKARVKKVLYCIFSLEAAKRILQGIQFTNRVFMSYISGKLLDSLIVGVICYIGTLIMGTPYALLCSVIVAVFNLIPFFGPVIGAVISALIVLTDSPLKMLIYVIFVIILQQFDGNMLGPRILGSRVGVNGFWVLFSIIVGAGLFGFAGMLLGVPVFVVIYTFFRQLINRKLARSGLPADAAEYGAARYFDPESGKAVPKEDEEPVKPKKAGRPKPPRGDKK